MINHTPRFGGSLGQEFGEIWNELKRGQIISGPGVRASRSTSGTIVELEAATGGVGGVGGLPPHGVYLGELKSITKSTAPPPAGVTVQRAIDKLTITVFLNDTIGTVDVEIEAPKNLQTMPTNSTVFTEIQPFYTISDPIAFVASGDPVNTAPAFGFTAAYDLNMDARLWVHKVTGCTQAGTTYTPEVFTIPLYQ